MWNIVNITLDLSFLYIFVGALFSIFIIADDPSDPPFWPLAFWPVFIVVEIGKAADKTWVFIRKRFWR